MNFYERYEDYPDSRIMEILKNHKNYQDSAVDSAVKIAIQRGLIHSEQDLLGPEFQNNRNFGFKLFPPISDEFQRQKLLASLFRFVYLLALVPLIFGILSYAKGEQFQALIGVGAGLFGLLMSVLLSKTRKPVFWLVLLAELIVIAATVGQKILTAKPILVLDLVMLLIGTLLALYILLYLRKLIR
jgi:hypothetical protein